MSEADSNGVLIEREDGKRVPFAVFKAKYDQRIAEQSIGDASVEVEAAQVLPVIEDDDYRLYAD